MTQAETPSQNGTVKKFASQFLDRFKAFDAAVDVEKARVAPNRLQASRMRMSALINVLPQRPAIKDSDIGRWLDKTYKVADERMKTLHPHGDYTVADVHDHVFWHVRRASGWGGSELGTIVKHYHGKRGNFGDVADLVKGKLLIHAPQPSTDVMERGARGEDDIQRIALKHANAFSRTDLLDKLRSVRWDAQPQLIGTPDDIVEYNDTGKIEVWDYKLPSADVSAKYRKNGVDDDYLYQVTGYEILAMSQGLPEFDGRAICAFNVGVWMPDYYPFEFQAERAREIIKFTSDLWANYVMEGIVPDVPETKPLENVDPVMARFGLEALCWKLIAEGAEARMKELQSKVRLAADEQYGFETGTMSLFVGDLNRHEKLDEAHLVYLAEQYDLDLEPFTKSGIKPDPDAAIRMANRLADALAGRPPEGMDVPEDVSAVQEEFRSGVPMAKTIDTARLAAKLREMNVSVEGAQLPPTTSISLSRKSRGPVAERLSELRDVLEGVLDHIEGSIEPNADRIVLGKSLEEIEETLDYDDAYGETDDPVRRLQNTVEGQYAAIERAEKKVASAKSALEKENPKREDAAQALEEATIALSEKEAMADSIPDEDQAAYKKEIKALEKAKKAAEKKLNTVLERMAKKKTAIEEAEMAHQELLDAADADPDREQDEEPAGPA